MSDFEIWGDTTAYQVTSTPPAGNTAFANVYYDQDVADIVLTDTLYPTLGAIPLVSDPPTGKERIVDTSWDPVALEPVYEVTVPALLVSNPPAGKKKVTNFYRDSVTLIPEYEVEP